MIEEQGIVVSVRGELAEVRTERRGGCSSCGSSGSCGTALIDRFFGRRAVTLEAWNEARAAVGERVLVGVDEGGLLVAAFAAYLVPVLGLVAGGLLGQWLGNATGLAEMSVSMLNLSALTGAFLGFVLALSWLRRYSAKRAQHPLYHPVVLRRLGAEDAFQSPTWPVDHP